MYYAKVYFLFVVVLDLLSIFFFKSIKRFYQMVKSWLFNNNIFTPFFYFFLMQYLKNSI